MSHRRFVLRFALVCSILLAAGWQLTVAAGYSKTVGTALVRCRLVKLRVIDGHVMFHFGQLDDEGEVPHRNVHDEG